MFRIASGLTALLAGACVLAAPAGSGVEIPARARGSRVAAEKLYAETYDVANLAHSKNWRNTLPGTDQVKQDGIDGIVEAILATSIDPADWTEGKKGGSSIHVLNGTKLEIITHEKQHKEIRELLHALERLTDLAVIVNSELLDVERSYYEKHIEPALARQQRGAGKMMGARTEPLELNLEKLRKDALVLKKGRVMIADRQEAPTFSWRKAFAFVAKPTLEKVAPREAYGSAAHGVSFQSSVAVSADRRFVRFKMLQKAADFLGMDRETIYVGGEKLGTIEAPQILESAVTTALKVADGETVLVPVHCRSLTAKDRVQFLLVNFSIYIADEDKANAGVP